MKWFKSFLILFVSGLLLSATTSFATDLSLVGNTFSKTKTVVKGASTAVDTHSKEVFFSEDHESEEDHETESQPSFKPFAALLASKSDSGFVSFISFRQKQLIPSNFHKQIGRSCPIYLFIRVLRL
ncbi:hypothetical protein [Flavobacterium aurantiibacter]|uniref:Uncharacterized protein n=1 Tax=Flavobacterium aurantiibacter TaxID=2023067 RepID=A0A255ZN10_9FLAO|nr:hypothetical protein [Flavobacterium aurantiibacter]OYQ42903.1 hypothetical protein CHX27_11440 [Flavobacterium aurantiibacter]